VGIIAKFFLPDPENKDPNARMIKFAEESFVPHTEKNENKSKGMIAGNNAFTYKPLIILQGSDLICEFFSKELKHFKRVRFPTDIETEDHGFVLATGDKGLRIRAPFQKFFEYKNIIRMIPELEKCFQIHYDALLEKTKSLKDGEWLTIDMNQIIDEVFNDIVNQTLFGDTNPETIPKVDG
jgi:hypothetical protein